MVSGEGHDSAGLREIVGMVVVAGQDCDRFRKAFEPFRGAFDVVVPHVAFQHFHVIEGVALDLGGDHVKEALASVLGPVHVLHAVESEVAEAFVDEVVGCHFSGFAVFATDVRDVGKRGFEILCQYEDALFREKAYVILRVELSDYGVRVVSIGVFDHCLDTEAVADGQRKPADVPCLTDALGISCDSEEQSACIGFREVCHIDDARHFL